MSGTTSIEGPPRPRPEIETAFVGGEAVLLNVETGSVYALNPSASLVWLLLDGVLQTPAVAAELSEIIQVPADELLPDVEAAVAGFAEQRLLDQPPASATPLPSYLVPPPDP